MSTDYKPPTNRMVLIFTLDGYLHALDSLNGFLLWSKQLHHDSPIHISHSQSTSSTTRSSAYLVEPFDDGQIYLSSTSTTSMADDVSDHTFNDIDTGYSSIQKLPFTIKKLVDISPFRALDDTLYIGYKNTEIITIDLDTGSIVFKSSSKLTPQSTTTTTTTDIRSNLIYMARTEQTVLIFDSNDFSTPSYPHFVFTVTYSSLIVRRWNLTMNRFHSPDLVPPIRNIPSFIRMIPGLDGSLLAWNTETDRVEWTRKFDSIVISAHSVIQTNDGKFQLIQVDFDSTPSTVATSNSQISFPDNNINMEIFISSIHNTPFVLSARRYHRWIVTPSHINKNIAYITKSLKASDVLAVDADCHPGSILFPECVGDSQLSRVAQIESTDPLLIYPPLLLDGSVSIGDPSSSSTTMRFYTNDYNLVGILLSTTLALFLGLLYLYHRLKKQQSTLTVNDDTNETKLHNKKKKKKLKNSNSESTLSINSDLTLSETVLGYGSNGTVVMKGLFQGRTVAVKRLLVEFYELAENEINLLRESDDHYNVIRYFYVEKTTRFIHLVLDLCIGSLHDLFDMESSLYYSPDIQNFRESHSYTLCFEDVLAGIRHLHSLNIIHRDLKPHNILINIPPNASSKLVISDFGLCKRLVDGQTSYEHTFNRGAGSYGWRAPEVLLGLSSDQVKKISPAVDIFAAGLILYYILSRGGHAFGEQLVRETNIINGDVFIDGLMSLDQFTIEKSLIREMLQHEPSKRPKAQECLDHPIFWSCATRLSFLQELSDRLDVEERDSDLLQSFELINVRRWLDKVDSDLFENLGKYRRYNTNSVADLLRAIRNKKNHYQDLPEPIKMRFGQMPDGYFEYFHSRFPNLFIDAYEFVKKHDELRDEAVFRAYF